MLFLFFYLKSGVGVAPTTLVFLGFLMSVKSHEGLGVFFWTTISILQVF